ncbi:SDR family oxidoreductase [Cellulomonas sp. PhB143]|uniref:SDR family oxidoreductase n=1 Tax=Cellulomonas sp. PhB143 TaxID=2485186 RepID=UPI000FB4C5A9|nr:SDR family oxidoreductase [Cellulomonas sp. PhB143]ROS78965.1 short-subunit dehydrogenase [Cellulomonas sp. PhB143]
MSAAARPPARPGAVVVGATGFVGSGTVASLGSRGWGLVASGRSAARLGELEGAPGVVATLDARTLGDPSSSAPDDAVAALARAHAVRGAVAAIGGWWVGDRLEDLDLADWEAFLASHLTAHLVAARRLVPLLPPGAAYVVLNGAASYEPMAGSGPVSVTGAALHMMVDVLRAEARPGTVRYREVVVGHAVAGDVRNLDPQREVTLEDVARVVRRALGDGAEPLLRC